MTPSRRFCPGYPMVKRLLDLSVGLLLLVPVLLVLVLAGVAGLVTQGPPVLFVQQRVGWNRSRFTLVKLRTMTGAPSDGRAYHEQHRITGYGRVIRRLRVDEVPQLLHVLAGRMSLVGPRPLLDEHLALVDGGGRRHEVRPGLTCFAQLELARHGYLDKHDQIRLDEAYVDRMSLRTDLAVLGRTLALLGRGPSRGRGCGRRDA